MGDELQVMIPRMPIPNVVHNCEALFMHHEILKTEQFAQDAAHYRGNIDRLRLLGYQSSDFTNETIHLIQFEIDPKLEKEQKKKKKIYLSFFMWVKNW